MIAELVEDQKLAVLELGDQVIRRKFRIGFLRPRLDLNITKPVVTGLRGRLSPHQAPGPGSDLQL